MMAPECKPRREPCHERRPKKRRYSDENLPIGASEPDGDLDAEAQTSRLNSKRQMNVLPPRQKSNPSQRGARPSFRFIDYTSKMRTRTRITTIHLSRRKSARQRRRWSQSGNPTFLRKAFRRGSPLNK